MRENAAWKAPRASSSPGAYSVILTSVPMCGSTDSYRWRAEVSFQWPVASSQLPEARGICAAASNATTPKSRILPMVLRTAYGYVVTDKCKLELELGTGNWEKPVTRNWKLETTGRWKLGTDK